MLKTPYDGSSMPFTIGLKPLDQQAWIEVDGELTELLAEKERLIAAIPDAVFAAEPDTEAAQRELLALLIDHLLDRYPQIYRRDGEMVLVNGARRLSLAGSAGPLLTAARLVADDLVLMRRSTEGWRLAAASLCFPSSWTLAEKFGRQLDDIHAPVPGFEAGTRNAALIGRIFDNLGPGQPVIRWNWSLQADRALYKPMSSLQRDERAATRPARFPEGAAGAFIRVERQTLRRLPVSGDIVFTIRIFLDPMTAFATHPDGRALALSFASQLEALDMAQLDYKGLAADRDRLSADLRRMAGGI